MNANSFFIASTMFLIFGLPLFWMTRMAYLDEKEFAEKYKGEGYSKSVLFLGAVAILLLVVVCYWIYEIELKRLGG